MSKKRYLNYQEKTNLWQAWEFPSENKKGSYYICTIYHQSLHECSVRLFIEKYQIISADLYHPIKSFDENFYICKTCHKHLYKKEISCQAVWNKMALDVILDELMNLKR